MLKLRILNFVNQNENIVNKREVKKTHFPNLNTTLRPNAPKVQIPLHLFSTLYILDLFFFKIPSPFPPYL